MPCVPRGPRKQVGPVPRLRSPECFCTHPDHLEDAKIQASSAVLFSLGGHAKSPGHSHMWRTTQHPGVGPRGLTVESAAAVGNRPAQGAATCGLKLKELVNRVCVLHCSFSGFWSELE